MKIMILQSAQQIPIPFLIMVIFLICVLVFLLVEQAVQPKVHEKYCRKNNKIIIAVAGNIAGVNMSSDIEIIHGNEMNQSVKDKFNEVNSFVKNIAEDSDEVLKYGAIQQFKSIEMFEKATGINAFREKDWDRRVVFKKAHEANWNFEYNTEDAWAYFSAKKLLETCAELKVGISFAHKGNWEYY